MNEWVIKCQNVRIIIANGLSGGKAVKVRLGFGLLDLFLKLPYLSLTFSNSDS
jgi:hypothetical protein